MEYINKSPLMDKVLEAVMEKYNCSRSEAYPFVIGMATELISVEQFDRMLSVVKN
jgi:hypothetical protein